MRDAIKRDFMEQLEANAALRVNGTLLVTV
jgi:hypothetical protein